MPGLSAVNVNFSPVASTLDLNAWPSLTTVWGMSSPLVQVIWVPAFTLSAAGEKAEVIDLDFGFLCGGRCGGHSRWGRLKTD